MVASGDRAEALVKEKPVARAAGGTECSRGRARGPGGRWDPSCWRRGRPPCTAGLVAPERFQLQGATSTLLCLRGLQTSRGSPESEPRRACAGPTARAGSPEAAVSGLSSCGCGGAAPALLAPFCDGELPPTQAVRPPSGPSVCLGLEASAV